MRNRISVLSAGVLLAVITAAMTALILLPPPVNAARRPLEGRALTGGNEQSVSRKTGSQSGNSGSATKTVPPAPPPPIVRSHRPVHTSGASKMTNDPNGESKVSSGGGNSSPPAVPVASGQDDAAPAPAGFNYSYNEFHPFPNGREPPGTNETANNQTRQ